MQSLISPSDHWTLWTFLVATAGFSIFLEQRNKLAAKFTGPVIALIIGMLFSNLGIIPTEAPTYDVVWEFVVPLAIPLLLMKMNIRKIFKETGRMFGAFHLSALGSFLGGVVAVFLLKDLIVEVAKIGGIMTASYIGGGVNFVAMVSTFKPPESIVNATIVADNGVMALYFLLLLALPTSVIVRKIFPPSHFALNSEVKEGEQGAKAFWKPKPISLLDIGISMSLAFIVAAVSFKISDFFSSEGMPLLIKSILGQRYLVLTSLSITIPLVFPKFSEKIAGSEELGTFLIFIFFVLIGVPASFKTVILTSPLLLLFCSIMLAMNFFITFGLGKVFKFELEELILAASATSGGPMNAAAIAISKGWKTLIFPSFLVGIWGYVIGNYIGYVTGLLLIKLVG
ncbi:MAG: hypothetical protein DRJ11_06325 [Candidatus Aminicenantes bacterium]|nr:MAG: hypothetical protein DRJ11_06325 [Candidatus Aminicenantes bacterium]